MRSLRTRLALTLVLLVTLTVAAIGIGVYAFVDASLRDRLVAGARQQADFNLSVLLPAIQPQPADRAAFGASGLPEQFRLRGDADVIADFGDGEPWVPARLPRALDEVPPALRTIVGRGELGYAWQPMGDEPSLVVGARPAAGPSLYFVFPARAVEDALGQLRLGLLAGGLIARGILRPVTAGAAAARRIADGDLDARVPTGGTEEMARWAREFNRMADSLQSTVTRLEAAQGQNRRFVADVTHELRTPLTALVAEASVLEASIDTLPPDGRRAAQLLVADARRMRTLVDDLLEISRFDAAVEQPAVQAIDLGRLVTAVVSARHPEATVVLPSQPV